MIHWYTRWNRKASRLLWWLVIVALLASLPLAYERVRTETSAKHVEFVFDYRDLLDISEFKPNPQQYIDQQLDAMKKAGVQSMAVYESTLNELRQAKRIDLYSSREIAVFDQKPAPPGENATYVLFADSQAQQRLAPIIERAFQKYQIKTEPWSYGGRQGLKLAVPPEEASLKVLDPDPFALEQIKQKGLRVVARLSNRSLPFSEADMDRVLSAYKQAGARTVIFEGEAVPGYDGKENSDSLKTMAGLLNKYQMTLANIELLKAPQKGFNTLAKELKYRVIRLHSFTEAEADKLTGNLTEQEMKDKVQATSDRFVLAVKDRNIRMVFLNARPSKNPEKASYTDPVDQVLASLNGEDGAIPRIKKAGYSSAPAEAFAIYQSSWQKFLKPITVAGAVALVALTIGAFLPWATLGSFAIGLVGSAGLYLVANSLLLKMIALGAAICAPTIATILAIQRARRRSAAQERLSPIGFTVNLFVRTVGITLIGVVFVIALLNNVIYSLVIDQFRGVSLLHLAPILLVGLYLVLFSEGLSGRQIVDRAKTLLSMNIRVLWVVLAAIFAVAIMYYLSRTGNEGQASAFEKFFRSFLENTLRVRPRFKEFLIAHPLFLLGGYLAVKYRPSALYLLVLGVIGQLSIVDTFCHLHTPVVISAIRVGYGILFGVIIGLIYIGIWEILVRGWKRWVRL
ncbi:hypothetical protein J31TS4_42470 [Paenibacillus sp. J31TS4]|uniref:DUF5693 family protein n=1 Tax=Paenibacillus sp. J31TS4 TaxID=2807195 RepID=UPI001B1B1D4B|nr:DUF5693 family protein [Paenibacillus sp. J31TS4]GIP40967.1 hypothetical protein J31TS4_42470 [Paenibacillus sp. J31TS4]